MRETCFKCVRNNNNNNADRVYTITFLMQFRFAARYRVKTNTQFLSSFRPVRLDVIQGSQVWDKKTSFFFPFWEMQENTYQWARRRKNAAFIL